MTFLPPRAVRRLVALPVFFGITALLLSTMPLWLLAAAALSPVLPGRLRALRLLWLLLVYLVLECAGVVAAFVLWVRSGFGARLRSDEMQEAHYRLIAVLVAGLYRWGARGLGVTLDVRQVAGHPPRPEESSRPLLVLCRHAGPGDSLLMLHEVAVGLGRRPRIVLKDLLQWDPLLDVVLNRVPSCFVPSRGGEAAGERTRRGIAALAEGMSARDALLLFPEGGNFTPARRSRAITRLRTEGRAEAAQAAEAMAHLLAPRPGGVFAAVAATPVTDVLFVAHTGLEHLSTPADLWRGLPLRRPVRVGWWSVAEEDVPAGEDERVEWLFGMWGRMDRWIAAQRDEGVTVEGSRGGGP